MPIDYAKSHHSQGPQAAGARPVGVSLTKDRPTVTLTKPAGELRINLNWTSRPPKAKKGGFLTLFADDAAIDLDLGCLYELADGTKGVVQALGESFGQLDRAPYIRLDGDDRSGRGSRGENLYVNLAKAAEIRRILVFACLYHGAPSFDQANGVVTLSPASGPPIEVRLDERAAGSRMCAIALLERDGADLRVRREVRYVDGGQQALDQAYGWGMSWRRGRK